MASRDARKTCKLLSGNENQTRTAFVAMFKLNQLWVQILAMEKDGIGIQIVN
jgi:hypothetical protein